MYTTPLRVRSLVSIPDGLALPTVRRHADVACIFSYFALRQRQSTLLEVRPFF